MRPFHAWSDEKLMAAATELVARVDLLTAEFADRRAAAGEPPDVLASCRSLRMLLDGLADVEARLEDLTDEIALRRHARLLAAERERSGGTTPGPTPAPPAGRPGR